MSPFRDRGRDRQEFALKRKNPDKSIQRKKQYRAKHVLNDFIAQHNFELKINSIPKIILITTFFFVDTKTKSTAIADW